MTALSATELGIKTGLNSDPTFFDCLSVGLKKKLLHMNPPKP